MKAIRLTEEVAKAAQEKADRAWGGRMAAKAEKTPQIAPKQAQRSKHGAVKIVVDGFTFASHLEARCWQALKLRQAAGEIRNLARQVTYALFGPRGRYLCKYKADFEYEEKIQLNAWRWVTADAKSAHTRKLPGWSRTKALMQICHSITVIELP